jgi:CTD small phosphatase-like protein 2
LKASAIASVSAATFPNNFQNLPKVSPPFLGPIQEDKKYCLVLDLDETLIHNVEVSKMLVYLFQFGAESYFLVRPGCIQFIETMAKYYEIVIFTAALQEYADQVIDQIDVGNNIKTRLYRQHTS